MSERFMDKQERLPILIVIEALMIGLPVTFPVIGEVRMDEYGFYVLGTETINGTTKPYRLGLDEGVLSLPYLRKVVPTMDSGYIAGIAADVVMNKRLEQNPR